MNGEREAIADFIRKQGGAAGIRLLLGSGMPGGTRTARVKHKAFADGFCRAVTVLADAIERGDHCPVEGQAAAGIYVRAIRLVMLWQEKTNDR